MTNEICEISEINVNEVDGLSEINCISEINRIAAEKLQLDSIPKIPKTIETLTLEEEHLEDIYLERMTYLINIDNLLEEFLT